MFITNVAFNIKHEKCRGEMQLNSHFKIMNLLNGLDDLESRKTSFVMLANFLGPIQSRKKRKTQRQTQLQMRNTSFSLQLTNGLNRLECYITKG